MTRPSPSSLVDTLRAAGCVFAEDEAALLLEAAGSAGQLDALVRRRVSGEPLEQVLGWVDFCGRRRAVSPGVFVPRRRSALLVHEGAALAALAGPGAVLLDLCCGSGAIGAAVAERVPGLEVYAADVDPAATACARRNLGPAAVVVTGDLFAPLPEALRGRVDVLVANVPYVPSSALGQLPPEARDHEPRAALDGGGDGLEVLRRVASEAPGWLLPGGHLLSETSRDQVPVALAVLEAAGLAARSAHDDELGATVVLGRLPHGGLGSTAAR